MSIVKEDVPAIKHPENRKARMLPTDRSDFIWTGILGTLWILSSSYLATTDLGWLTSLTVIPVIGLYLLSMYTPENSKYNERIYRVPIVVARNWKLAMNHGEMFRSEESVKLEREIAQELTEEERKSGSSRRVIVDASDLDAFSIGDFDLTMDDYRRILKVFPLEGRGLRVDENETLGLIYHKEKHTYSMVFCADGSPMRNLPHTAQYGVMRGFASLISKTTAAAGFRGLSVSSGIRNRPQDQWLIPETMLEVGDPDVILPRVIAMGIPEEEWTADDRMDVNLHYLQNDFAELTVQSNSIAMMFVITVKETEPLRQAFKKSSMPEKEFRRLPIVRIQKMILPTLEKLVGGPVRILDVPGIERYLREARDVATLFSYNNEAELTKVTQREQARQGEPVVIDSDDYRRYLPKSHIIAKKHYLNVDGTYASVLDMTTFPQEPPMHAHEMPDLADAESRWSSFSVIGQAAKSGLEYTVLNNVTGILGDLADRIGIVRSGPKVERKQNEQYDWLSDIERARATQQFVVRFATLQVSEEELEEDLAKDVSRFTGLGFGPVQVAQESQQWSKFLTTVTLVDCE